MLDISRLWSRGKSLDDKDVKLATMNYLVRMREDGKKRVTANLISKKAPEFITKTQRPQRITAILEEYKKKTPPFVADEPIENGKLWWITEEGYQWFKASAPLIRQGLY